ncbi:hypothetical protein DICVIV_00077 [Dictyocaulus viviparus]|uniref:Uncharacterized protein n=1 Tax=Dictyocaulus viviparus TaxID=29172 RepID=A0A0D8YC67_DICVI|nr:hypothetical protein DICVIV_00077 [Dictyocaulus viviparus]
MRCLANYEAANKNLERARGRNKDIPKLQKLKQSNRKRARNLRILVHWTRTELKDLKKRRVLAFKRNLADLADLEIKHAKVCIFKPSSKSFFLLL